MTRFVMWPTRSRNWRKMDDVAKERIRQALINAALKLSEVAGRSTLNPKIAEYIDMVIERINELLPQLGGSGIL